MSYKFVENHLELDKVPARIKKLTATRFATVMGLNAWSTPFEAWCEITKTYAKPFEDTKYTIAGKMIEPKVCEYLRRVYFLDIKSPTDVYGADYFNKTWGDFFPTHTVFGGMWDFLGDDFVVEVKTTKRAEDWSNDIPIYYKLQAGLYAYLLGFDDVIVTVSFLDESDYDHPEDYKPNAENTKIYEFKMSEDFPNFKEDYVDPALEWWETYVEKGISPDFDEKKDAEILQALRKNIVGVEDSELNTLLKEYDKLMVSVTNAEEKLKGKKDRIKEIESALKKYMSKQFRDGDTKVELTSNKFTFVLSKQIKKDVDKDKLKKDGLLADYEVSKESLVLRKTEIKEEN